MTSKSLEKEYTIIVMDNDECIGAWSLSSAIHGIFADYLPKNTGIPVHDCIKVFKDCIVKYYLSNGGARPGTKDTLKLLKLYKDTGKIDKVVMFTSCTNEKNWVMCLKECLEQYADVYGLYDLVLHRDNTESKNSKDGATIKNMDIVIERLCLNQKNCKIIMVDDRPQNILGDCIKVAVSPYMHVVDENYISDMIDEMVNTLQKMYKKSIGIKTNEPIQFRNMLKKIILVDNGGRRCDISKNIRLNCLVNQLNDKSLIGILSKTFVNHIPTTSLVRSISEIPVHRQLIRSVSW
jgi:hypothetical protein